MTTEIQTEAAAVQSWLTKIQAAEKVYRPYYDCVDETRFAYKGQNESGSPAASFHIFWSTVESQKPFLYFLQPKPCLERVHKATGPAEKLACRILERALEWDLRQFDFDSVAKYVRNDYLISGCGVAWESYQPVFKSLIHPENPDETVTVKVDETVVTRYIDPKNFVADCENVGIWENIGWMGCKTFMTPADVHLIFGETVADLVVDSDEKRSITVYEIWDKARKQVFWVSPELPDRFLKMMDDPLHLTGFFPCPKPLFATLSNDSIVPVPDYMMIKELVRELNGIVTRMRLTMQAVKVSGVYDNAFYQLGDIFEKDVTLVSLAEFDKLKTCGGIRGVIDFIPIEQYITALEQLAKRRADVQQQIFEITGVSDIMRGTSNAKETATAVAQKTHFGTLRNQDRQNDMQRFLNDLYQIKAEIICAQFSKEKLMSFLTAEERNNLIVAEQAVALLRSEKMRGMVLHIETDSVFNHDQQTQDVLTTVNTISKMITDALPAVSAQPLLLPLYRQMIETVASVMPHARSFETVLEQVFSSVSSDLAKPDAQMPQQVGQPTRVSVDPRTLQLEQMKVQTQYEIDKEKNALKAQELALKSRELDYKNAQLKQELVIERAKVAEAAGQVA